MNNKKKNSIVNKYKILYIFFALAIPVAIIAFVLWVAQNIMLDRKLKKKYSARSNVGGAK